MSEEPKSFWGKLATITAFLGAVAAVGGVVSKCAGTEPLPAPNTQFITTPTLPTTYPPPATATVCMTLYGGCPLFQAMSPGMTCTCYNAFGYPLVSGISR